MKYIASLILKLIVLACLIYSTAAKDDLGEDLKTDKRGKKYLRLKAEDFSAEVNTLQKEVIPVFIFPEQARDITTALKNGTSEISILMKVKEPFNHRTLVDFPALDDLKHLHVYHSLTLDKKYDRQKLKALQGLLKAPNLETIEFTAFLAEDILPHIGPKVKAMADFEHRDMGAATMVPKNKWDEEVKNQLLQLCTKRGWRVMFPSHLSSSDAGS